MHPSSTTNSETAPTPLARSKGVVDRGDVNGLIDEAPYVPSQKLRFLYAVIVALFVLVNGVSGVVDSIWPAIPPEPVGEEKEQLLARRQAAQWQDGSLARWLEEESQRRSRVRQSVLPSYSLLIFEGLGYVRNHLILGRQGWLFLRRRTEHFDPRDDVLLTQATELLSSLAQRSAEAGHRLVILPIPRKSALAAQYLPPSVESKRHLDLQLPAILRASGLDIVDILPMLDDLPNVWGETPYYREDSHLTPSAMLGAAELIARHLDMWTPPEQRSTRLRHLGQQPANHDLLGLAGIETNAMTRRLAHIEKRLDFEVLDSSGQTMKATTSGGQITLIGTSFSSCSDFSTYLTHYLDQPVADLSDAGLDPIHELDALLEKEPSSPLPRVIILEVPNYSLFGQRR